MDYPPSLGEDVLARCFKADNGEVGVLPSDVPAFLDACERDGISVLGWEMWLVDHADDTAGRPVAARGYWTGMIPLARTDMPAVWGNRGDVAICRADIEAVDLTEVDSRWRPFIRFNFTPDD